MNITTNYHIETVGSGAFGSAVLKNGLNGGLQEIVRSVQNSTGQHPDGLRIDAPGFKPVLVVTSLTAWRGFFGRDAVGPEGCPYSRDETMGIYSGSSEVLGIKDEKDSGIALSPPKYAQQERKKMVREALESNFDPEQTAKNCVEALEFSRRSRVVDVVTDVIRPALIGSIFEAGENYNELHELARRRLGGAALATTLEGKLWPKAISKALNIRDRYRGVDARDINRPRLLDEGCPYTESDLLALYATTGAIVAAALWATNRTCFTASDSEKGDLDHKAIALESLRFGGLNTSLPPRTLEFGGKSVITCISPAMVLRDPSIVGADPFSFNEGRFGPSNDGTSSRVIAAAFGYGMHRCPSSTVIPPFLESLSAQLAGSGLAVSQSDPRYPARSDLNAFRPRAGHDSIVI